MEKLCISTGLLNTESTDRRLQEGSKRVLTNERMQVLASVKKGGRMEKERNKQKARRMEMTAWSEGLEWFIKAMAFPSSSSPETNPHSACLLDGRWTGQEGTESMESEREGRSEEREDGEETRERGSKRAETH